MSESCLLVSYPAGQLTSKDYPDTVGVIDYVYDYNDAGNLTVATDPSGTTLMDYDPDTDDLVRIDYPGGQFFVAVYALGVNLMARGQLLHLDALLTGFHAGRGLAGDGARIA